MKKRLFTLVLTLAISLAVYLPAQAKNISFDNKSSLSELASSNALRDVRYVRVRGKRYKVWYTTYYRKGKRYIRITKVRRA